MRYLALACDYDGTLAGENGFDDATRTALLQLKATGRRLILVTGRRIDDLEQVCPDLSPFDCVVGENGAVLYSPATRETRTLVEPPPPAFAEALKRRGVPEVVSGRVIVATWQPYETVVLQVIRDLQLEMQVIFNKGAVMVLPSGVNKGTGLSMALEELRLSPHNVVAVGDAENDHALLAGCACGVAVANALPMLKQRADLVTTGHASAGVAELALRIIRDDLADLEPSLGRHHIPIGVDQANQPVTLPSYGATVLLAGTSGAGKSTFATAFLEELSKRGYQYCIVDPEGDYGVLPNAVVVGGPQLAPVLDELIKVLDTPTHNAVVNLVGVPLPERPAFFDTLLPRLKAERMSWGRPHWIVVDEAHHVAPRGTEPPKPAPPEGDPTTGLLLITVHPEHVALAALASVNVVVIVGAGPDRTLGELAATLGVRPPVLDPTPLEPGEAFVWWPHRPEGAIRVRTAAPQSERRRHQRKYIEGTLSPELSFYFRGPEGKLNLRAHNLTSFLELADGVDDDTWGFHLKGGAYSRWIADVVHDQDLAQDVATIEREGATRSPRDTRGAVRSAVERRYMVGSPPM